MKVEVLDPRVSGEAGKVTVELVQTYTDDRYRDRGRKRLTLERQNGVLLIAHEELFESQAPESGKECSETSGTAGAGTLLLRTCVIASKERTFKDDRLKRVTLTYRTVSGSSVETALAPVSDGWEWDQQWAIAGTLTDASGARAVVLRKLSGDVAFEWNELEVRALSPGLPVLWTSKDVFMQPAFDERGDKITVVAKRGAITKDDDMGKLETASPTTTTLRFTGGKVSESK